jgi:hypothetical protein
LRVPAEREVGVDSVLERRKTKLLEPPDLGLGKRLGRELTERRPSAERERLAQPFRRRGMVAAGERFAAFRRKSLELLHVERVMVEQEHVATWPGLDQPVGRRQRLPQLRDVDLKGLGRALRGLAIPELLDEPILRHDAVCVHEQDRKERALLTAGKWNDPLAVPDLERPEDPKLHPRLCSNVPRSPAGY